MSESSKLSGSALEVLCTACKVLGELMEPLAELFITSLIKLCNRPNKVVLLRAENTLCEIFTCCEPKKCLPRIFEGFSHINKPVRIACAKCFHLLISSYKCAMEFRKDIEAVFLKALEDSAVEVRELQRKSFYSWQERYPNEAAE